MKQKPLNELEIGKQLDPILEAERSLAHKAAQILALTNAEYFIEFNGEVMSNNTSKPDRKPKKNRMNLLTKYYHHVCETELGQNVFIPVDEEDDITKVGISLRGWCTREYGPGTCQIRTFKSPRQIVFTRFPIGTVTGRS